MGTAEELVPVYDADGVEIGVATRAQVRAEGLWHAATAVLVCPEDGQRVYVHLRSPHKDVYPAMHDCWTGGVLLSGESPSACAERELAEELGIRGVTLEPLFTLRYVDGTVRYHAHTFVTHWDGPVVHQPEEVVAGWWMDLTELRARLADPTWPFVPDGRLLFQEWERRRNG